MIDDADAWAVALDISPAMAADFKRLAATMNLSPTDVLRKMAERLITLNRQIGDHGLGGIEDWVGASEHVDDAIDYAIGALPLNVRPTTFMWPSDKPFPWTAEECRAAVIGYEVKWSGEFADFVNLVRGKWEFAEGYAFLHQS